MTNTQQKLPNLEKTSPKISVVIPWMKMLSLHLCHYRPLQSSVNLAESPSSPTPPPASPRATKCNHNNHCMFSQHQLIATCTVIVTGRVESRCMYLQRPYSDFPTSCISVMTKFIIYLTNFLPFLAKVIKVLTQFNMQYTCFANKHLHP